MSHKLVWVQVPPRPQVLLKKMPVSYIITTHARTKLKNIYNIPKKNIKILYDKESKVLSVEMKRVKSVDSDIHENVVIDYDKRAKW